MVFKNFNEKIKQQVLLMCQTGNKLFRSSISGREVWDLYLNSFKPEHDPVFRDPESSKHNGNLDKSFIRRYGNIIAIDGNNNIITLFDLNLQKNCEYYKSCQTISKALKSAKISNVFFETYDELNSLNYEKTRKNQIVYRLGLEKNHKIYTEEEAQKFGVVTAGKVYEFNHFHIDIPNTFVDKSGRSVEAIMGEYKSAYNVFKRGMEEIPLDTLQLVRDLILQGSLLNGDAHIHKIEKIIPLKQQYDDLSKDQRDNWCWKTSYNFEFSKFKNELIGVLCSELAEGEELNKACRSWNKRVDPANYMKAVAPITQKQKDDARKFVEENGYVESFDRRHATLDDIKVDEIRHINVGNGNIKSASIFDGVKVNKSNHKRNEFKNIEEVSIDKFMKDILPGCSSVEAFVENRHENNFVNLTTSNQEDCKDIFKWGNSYSWTYKGNLAGKSQIKEAVKYQGGKVDGVLRFSIMWAENNGDNSDLDAHCIEPNGNRIYFSYPVSRTSGGNLDIDVTQPQSHKLITGKEVVENITFPSLSKMRDGVYKLIVHQYSARGSQGFKAEIEFNGEIYAYEYNHPVKGYVNVAEVTLKNGEFTIKHILPSSTSSREINGIETKKFHKVNLMCLSPNYWGDNKVGNKHYFFMLDGCKTKDNLRSFHNENLKTDLAKHRKVLEVLGAVNTLEPADKQLAGLGFNATVRDEVVLKLGGSHRRVICVKF